MKRTGLARYERTDTGSIVIDVAAAQVEELYNNYDRSAPYIRRDLDYDLVEYLIDSAREIMPERFIIRFSLSQPPDEERQSRICRSVNAYFLYLADGEQQKILQMYRRSATLLAIGLAFLFLSVSVNPLLEAEKSVMAHMLAQGLTIAVWVALWESLGTLFFERLPHRKNFALYRRLADAEIAFRPEQAWETEDPSWQDKS